MNRSTVIINELLVELFNDVLQIEEQSLKNGPISDISITEIHTLEAIGMYDEKTMSEVAQNLKITVGTLTTAINKLIKKDYVERKRIEEDRRVVLIKLTEKGETAYNYHKKFHDELVHNTIGSLEEDEKEILISSLDRIKTFFMDRYDI